MGIPNVPLQLLAFVCDRFEIAIYPFSCLNTMGDGFARVSIAIRFGRYGLAHETETSHTPFPDIEASVHELHVVPVIENLTNLGLVGVVKVLEFYPLVLQRLLDSLNFKHMVCMLSPSNFPLLINFYSLPSRAGSWCALYLSDVGS